MCTAFCNVHCLTATRTHVPCGITQCYLPSGRGDIPAFTLAKLVLDLADGWLLAVGCRFPGGVSEPCGGGEGHCSQTDAAVSRRQHRAWSVSRHQRSLLGNWLCHAVCQGLSALLHLLHPVACYWWVHRLVGEGWRMNTKTNYRSVFC